MGKDSLIKSTTKKAGSKKEKKPSKKKTAAKATGGQSKNEAPAKPKAAKKAEAGPTRQDLLFRKFTTSQPPENSQPPAVDLSGMTAPPLITSNDPQEVERLRALLEQRFSMEEIAAAAREPATIAPAEPPRPPVSIEELLFKQFSTPQPLDDTPPPAPDFSQMTAPPFIASNDPQEVERLQALLDRRFSMEEIAAAAQEPVAVEPPIAESTPQPQESEPVKVEPPVQAQTAEPQINETPAPEAPPAAVTVSIRPEVQAPAASAAPVEKPAPAPEPAASKPQEKKEIPQAAAPQAAAPPKEESKFQSPPSSPEPPPADSGWRSFKFGIAAVAAVFLLIMWGSFSNSGKYFVMPKKGAIEIWRGTFSPTGKEFLAVLHGVEPASEVKDAYSREEIAPILCNYYIGKADALLDVSGLPDYNAVSGYLQRAQEYADTDELRAAVQTRMDNIQRLSLMYKAEIDISKGTIQSLQAALQALKEAQRLTAEPTQLEMLNQKIAAVSASLAALEANPGDTGVKE